MFPATIDGICEWAAFTLSSKSRAARLLRDDVCMRNWRIPVYDCLMHLCEVLRMTWQVSRQAGCFCFPFVFTSQSLVGNML